MNKILIINTCANDLHYNEFVKPVEDIVKKCGLKSTTIHYKTLNTTKIASSSKIIICGTSLQDFEYLNHIKSFEFIKNYNKPILGICAGMQIICKVYGCTLTKATTIGMNSIDLEGFLNLSGKNDVYELHNQVIQNDKFLATNFIVYGNNKYAQAVQHKNKPLHATLFHLEVRNKHIIEIFLNATSE